MFYWGVSNINNWASIINRNTPYFNHTRSTVNKVSTLLIQTAELSFIPKNGGLTLWTSPRLWNLYLALSKGLTAKKIELYGVFYFSPRHCYKKISVV